MQVNAAGIIVAITGKSQSPGALDRDHDGSILDDLGGFLGDYLSGRGAGILSHIFGDQEGAVERGVSQASGLDLSKVGPLLMILAPIVMGALGRARREEGIGAGELPRELISLPHTGFFLTNVEPQISIRASVLPP